MTAMRLITQPELRTKKGLPFSAQWIAKLIKDGKFPKPFKPGGKGGNINAWVETRVDQWIKVISEGGEWNEDMEVK